MRIVGKITGYHGLKGEIKIYPLLDDISYFDSFEKLYIDDKEYTIKSWRPHKNLVLVLLEGINNLNLAEELKGHVEADLEEDLDDGDIYIEDLLNCQVYDEKKELVGEVCDYSDQGQALIHVKLEDKYAAKRELIVPFVDQYLLEIADDKKSITINLTDDLLELAL